LKLDDSNAKVIACLGVVRVKNHTPARMNQEDYPTALPYTPVQYTPTLAFARRATI